MNFNKLALAAAVAAAPATGMAMEPMQDSEMSGVTGQDGIAINLSTSMSTDLYVHDTDGFTDSSSNTVSGAGAIVIENFGLTDTTGADADIAIEVDAGADTANTTATLNTQITLGNDGTNDTTDVDVDLGQLSVAESNRTGSWGINGTNQSNEILDMGTLTLGAGTTLNVQLGSAEPQGHMILLDTSIAGGFSLSNFAISDAAGGASGGSIGASNLAVVNATGGTDLNLDVGIDAVAGGLQVSLNEFGNAATAATPGADIRITDQYLGSDTTNHVGDVEVVGLDLNGTTITVTGK
jgi:hypothetical protein